ncbi:hypothetical protein ACFWNK_38500 [Streptomyces sp. NPDC058417]|uniref:hypothetical protein n=1 Tax=unclassified Streptomyces TaxID=2593676 RepID=UPI00365AB1D8
MGQQFGNAIRVGVGLEARDEVADELHAPGGADPVREVQGLGRGRGGEVGLTQVEVGLRAVCEEDPAGLVPTRRQQDLALLDELVRGARVAEVAETLPGIDGEVGLGKPGAPRGDGIRGRYSEEVFGGVQGTQGPLPFALGGERSGEPEVEQGPGGRVPGAGQGAFQDVGGGTGVAPPGRLVGEVVDVASG